MKIDIKYIVMSQGLPVVQGELQTVGPDWRPLCMTCGEMFEFAQPLRESLIACVGVSTPVIVCPKCNARHLLADGQKAMILGPANAPRPERPKGIVLARVVTVDSLVEDKREEPLSVSSGDTTILTPGDYLAIKGEPIKPIRVPGRAALCCTCNTATEQHCPDCHRPLCLKTGCEASHAVPCPPNRRDTYV